MAQPASAGLIPSGAWTLWFHNPEDSKWSLSSFTKIQTFTTWEEFWTVIDSFQQIKLNKDYTDAFGEGMFFLMRDNIPPLWENSANIRGGCYSFRVQRREATDLFLVYTIATMIGISSANPENRINGVSISPKKNFNIIKIWNSNAKSFNNIKDIKLFIKDQKIDEFIYTPFYQKNM
ncbi:MAG: eukaryotic translation initiation factor EIF4E family protein [Actinobacteria bacterium]|nr:eukaryotic translation initiation factor EIF4E family protein [Actinomycetota bacterium]